MHNAIFKAAELLLAADGLFIAAGAGMGVDSGLPDFRGDGGFWKTYPALAQGDINFREAATPAFLNQNPAQAWGFWGHLLNLFRDANPHAGFKILHTLAYNMPSGYFVYTSNVDGQFQKAGFAHDRIMECHGSVHFLQCADKCTGLVWSANSITPHIDEDRCLFLDPLPRCPICDKIARPNILLFEDWEWLEARTLEQYQKLLAWRHGVSNLLVIEIGSGREVPSVRMMSESPNAPLIRINLHDEKVQRSSDIGIRSRGLDALLAIQDAVFALSQQEKTQ